MTGIVLAKRAEKVGIVLAKRGLTKIPPVRVGMALDVSGSAQGFYTGGVMQETIDRLLGVALKFDDNGEIDTWLFDNDVQEMPSFTQADEGTYVKQQVLNGKHHLWGGTSYAPPLQSVMDYYFGSNPVAQVAEAASGFFGSLFGKKKEAAPAAAPSASKKDPAMLLFVTDGQSNDEGKAERILREASSTSPMYFMMVGVGNPSYFTFLEKMADDLPNVGFVNLASLSMTDDQLYEQLVTQEFCDWIKKLG